MRLSVATNFDDELIWKIKDFPVEEVYGKLPRDFVGGGRSSYMLSPLSGKRIVRHISHAHKYGIKFNYLLNSACLNNLEFTRFGQKSLNRLLTWLTEIGVDSVTVSLPFLLEIVKKRFPGLHVRVGVFAQIDSVPKAKHWEELGADCICLDSLLVNRDFYTLKIIRQAVKCDLQLLVNNNCLAPCPFSPYHMTMLSHSSQSNHRTRGFVIDYCFLKCSLMKLKDPVNYLRSDWIRPEDLHYYEELGYDNFKLVERNAPTPIMVERVRAYAERRYKGNLLNLIQPFAYKDGISSNGHHNRVTLWALRFFLRPSLVNPFRLRKILELARKRLVNKTSSDVPPVYIDNERLNGFLTFFLNESCRNKDCHVCQYCHELANKAVKIDPQYQKMCLDGYQEIMEDIYSGKMWQ
jgi:collagenase-like PrtC family protease